MTTIRDVRDYWDRHPCGARLAEPGSEAWFERHRRDRYAIEPHIPEIAEFARYAGADVLEIGCGIGADGYEFARHGARYTGVDLTEAAVRLSRQRFEETEADGDFAVADAETLPFADASFDHVYSFGVIHHSPHPRHIVQEAYRVLRPGGTITVMLYNRDSINYRVEIMVLRKLFRHLLRSSWAPALFARVTGIEREKLERHRQLYLEKGAVDHTRWVSMNTDGPDCPLADVYGADEAAELFGDFVDVEQAVRFFDERHWPVIGARLTEGMKRALGARWGWHRIVRGRKPA